MDQGDFDRLGSTVVDLGNNFATTESEIVHMVLRLAGVGTQAGFTESQLLGIATTLSSVGIEAEAGGTAFSRVFAEMDKAVLGGGKELKGFNDVIGATGQDFLTLFDEGPEKALIAFVNGLQQIKEEGGNVHTALEELGFDNVRIRDALLRTAGAGDLLSDAINLGTNAWEENNALTREAELRFATASSQIQFAKNEMKDLAITVGGSVAPAFIKLINLLKPAVRWLNEFSAAHPLAIQVVLGLGLAVGGLGVALLTLAGIAKLTAVAIGGYSAAVVAANFISGLWGGGLLVLRAQLLALAIQQKITAIATWILNAALWANPIVLIVAGIIALVAALAVAGWAMKRFRKEIIGFLFNFDEWLAGLGDKARQAGFEFIRSFIKGLTGGEDPFGDGFLGFAEWLADLPRRARQAGAAFIKSFITGLFSGESELDSTMREIVGNIRMFLPFSDAKVGPLSDLTESGKRLIQTLGRGIEMGGNLPFGRVFVGLVEWLNNLPGRAREAGAEFIAAFIFGLTGGGNPFEDGFLGFLEWLNNLPGRAREAGAEFIAAFIFGLTGGGNPFEDGFLGFLEWLNNARTCPRSWG